MCFAWYNNLDSLQAFFLLCVYDLPMWYSDLPLLLVLLLQFDFLNILSFISTYLEINRYDNSLRFQTINRVSKSRYHHDNEESRSFKTKTDGQGRRISLLTRLQLTKTKKKFLSMRGLKLKLKLLLMI